MGIGALRLHYDDEARAAQASGVEPDFRELYKAAQREIDALRQENAELRAKQAEAVSLRDVVYGEAVPEAAAGDLAAAAKPRARK